MSDELEAMDLAPDCIGPILAWRCWRIVRRDRRLRLRSLVFDSDWAVRESTVAECGERRRFFLRWRQGNHEAPSADCSCGVYAVDRVSHAVAYLEGMFGALSRDMVRCVIGQVSLWGTIVQCEHGYRASVAYPARLYLPVYADSDEARAEAPKVAASLEDYGVPVALLHCRSRADIVSALQTESLLYRAGDIPEM